ncbi:MAG: S46 family peptidase [bacterium]|nr:S46 family peptidase [bacterium]
MRGDEGQWTPNNLPKAQLKAKYGFDVPDAWYEHIQKSVVRFPGGTGSFVSSNGLIMTNHHIASDCVQELSTKENNYYENGFLAGSRTEELPCPGTYVDVLMQIDEVTDVVNAAVTDAMSPSDASKARGAAILAIKKNAAEKTGFMPELVTLYQGGRYDLYLYKRYTDIRLVFAPEADIAMFGGDPDNFGYPRYDLDCAFMRAYENGAPVKPANFLQWSKSGANENDLVLIAGHPGRTDRAITVADAKLWRDVMTPFVLRYLYAKEIAYQQFGFRGKEEKRISRSPLFFVQNSRKSYEGNLRALQDPAFFAEKEKAETALRDAVAADPKKQAAYGDAWDAIAKANEEITRSYEARALIGGAAFDSELFQIARAIVAGVDPGDTENPIIGPMPINKDFEVAKLTHSLTFMALTIGCDDPVVKKILGGKSPEDRARELVFQSALDDINVRKALVAGDEQAVRSSNDPMLQLVVLVDGANKTMRKNIGALQETKRQAYAKIARLRWELYGTNTYPDATFTLRFAFGTAKGYAENGKDVPWATDFAGLFARAKDHDYEAPWKIPERWLKCKKSLQLDTPFNFVATTDLVGGNSGSPVVNKAGEVIGLIFDGNIQSLAWDFYFTEVQGRGVAVHSDGIRESLRKVYGAKSLADELGK